MRRTCRKIVTLIMLGTFLSVLTTPSEAVTTHIYIGGIVQEVSNNEISLNSHRYTLAPTVRVLAINKRNSAYFQDKASVSDILIGQPVKIKVEASTVYEVLIERWKQ